jgi:hypothetical protein
VDRNADIAGAQAIMFSLMFHAAIGAMLVIHALGPPAADSIKLAYIVGLSGPYALACSLLQRQSRTSPTR